jgi:hypothetical protein
LSWPDAQKKFKVLFQFCCNREEKWKFSDILSLLNYSLSIEFGDFLDLVNLGFIKIWGFQILILKEYDSENIYAK